jgi:hypothetical protein
MTKYYVPGFIYGRDMEKLLGIFGSRGSLRYLSVGIGLRPHDSTLYKQQWTEVYRFVQLKVGDL